MDFSALLILSFGSWPLSPPSVVELSLQHCPQIEEPVCHTVVGAELSDQNQRGEIKSKALLAQFSSETGGGAAV